MNNEQDYINNIGTRLKHFLGWFIEKWHMTHDKWHMTCNVWPELPLEIFNLTPSPKMYFYPFLRNKNAFVPLKYTNFQKNICIYSWNKNWLVFFPLRPQKKHCFQCTRFPHTDIFMSQSKSESRYYSDQNWPPPRLLNTQRWYLYHMFLSQLKIHTRRQCISRYYRKNS